MSGPNVPSAEEVQQMEWDRCRDCNRPAAHEIFGRVSYRCGLYYERRAGKWVGECGLVSYPYRDAPSSTKIADPASSHRSHDSDTAGRPS